MLRQSDADDSLKWFIAAGNRGQTEAMLNAGQMLASGRGVHAPTCPRRPCGFPRLQSKAIRPGMYARPNATFSEKEFRKMQDAQSNF